MVFDTSASLTTLKRPLLTPAGGLLFQPVLRGFSLGRACRVGSHRAGNGGAEARSGSAQSEALETQSAFARGAGS